MTKLVAVIPSYNRPGRLADTIEMVEQRVRPDDILVLDQPSGRPLGSAMARRLLLEEAVSRHGSQCAVLSLDDDLALTDEITPDSFRMVMDDLVGGGFGLVQIPNTRRPSGRPTKRATPPLTHAFMISGAMVSGGINYDPEEYADEVALSLSAYFSGWECARTGMAAVPHRVSRRGVQDKVGGGIEGGYADGVPVVCRLMPLWRDRGWVTYKAGTRGGVEIPTPYSSVRVTPAGRAEHARAKAILGP